MLDRAAAYGYPHRRRRERRQFVPAAQIGREGPALTVPYQDAISTMATLQAVAPFVPARIGQGQLVTARIPFPEGVTPMAFMLGTPRS